jgi:hypothetical protein
MLQQDSPAVQAVACEGLAKLMLSGMLYDATVSISGSAKLAPIEPLLQQLLQNLILLYLSPETATNLPLRQCLSYFFPVYCYSSVANQQRMRSVGNIYSDMSLGQAKVKFPRSSWMFWNYWLKKTRKPDQIRISH